MIIPNEKQLKDYVFKTYVVFHIFYKPLRRTKVIVSQL